MNNLLAAPSLHFATGENLIEFAASLLGNDSSPFALVIDFAVVDSTPLIQEMNHVYIYQGAEPTTVEADNLALWLDSIGKIKGLIAIGGGSALDLAKAAVAVRHMNLPSASMQGKIFEADGSRIPLVCIPTTAGSGAEATRSAVLVNKESRFKRGINGSIVQANHVILDPTFLRKLPEKPFAASLADSIAHNLESYLGRSGTKEVKGIAKSGLRYCLAAANKFLNNQNLDYTEAQIGAFLGGLAISNSNTGLLHAVSYPLSEIFGIKHGVAIAYGLPGYLDLILEKELLSEDDFDFLSSDPNSLRKLLVSLAAKAGGKIDKSNFIKDLTSIVESAVSMKGAIDNSPFEVNLDTISRVLDLGYVK